MKIYKPNVARVGVAICLNLMFQVCHRRMGLIILTRRATLPVYSAKNITVAYYDIVSSLHHIIFVSHVFKHLHCLNKTSAALSRENLRILRFSGFFYRFHAAPSSTNTIQTSWLARMSSLRIPVVVKLVHVLVFPATLRSPVILIPGAPSCLVTFTMKHHANTLFCFLNSNSFYNSSEQKRRALAN